MGFRARQQKTYIKYKEGKFYKTTDKELVEPLGDFEGRITDISLKMESIPGQPVQVEKLHFELDGGNGETYDLGISFNSSMASKLIGFLKSVDLTQEITLSPAFKKEGDKEIRTIFVKQGTGENAPYAKQYYTKDDNKGLPAMKKLKNGKWDNADFSDFYRDVVQELKNSLGSKTTELVEVPDTEGEEVTGSDGLPF